MGDDSFKRLHLYATVGRERSDTRGTTRRRVRIFSDHPERHPGIADEQQRKAKTQKLLVRTAQGLVDAVTSDVIFKNQYDERSSDRNVRVAFANYVVPLL